MPETTVIGLVFEASATVTRPTPENSETDTEETDR